MLETSFHLNSSARELMAKARAVTGIEIQDSEIEEAMAVLVPSLNAEARLTRQGALDMEERLLRILCNRLRMLRDFAAHPEIEDEVLLPPIFLTGGPRTGSTKLHHLLSASGDFRYLTFWQTHTLSLRTGERTEDPAPRIKEADDYVNWCDKTSPGLYAIHGYATHDPEEDTLIYEQLGLGFLIITMSWCPTFAAWYWQAPFKAQIEKYRRALKYIQWQFPESGQRRWLLKYPAYQGFEHVLEQYFPGASFITSNRNPVNTISSMVSLMVNYQMLYADTAGRGKMLGPFMVEGQRQRLLLFMQSREEHAEIPVFGVSYSDLTKHPKKVIEDVYAFTGAALTPEAKQRMLDWDNANVQYKHGVHRHDLADIDVTQEQVETAFKPYIDAYGALF